MMVSFVLSFFPRDVLDEILNLIESVSEDFPSYFCHIYSRTSVARTLMARLPRLFRTRSFVPRKNPLAADLGLFSVIFFFTLKNSILCVLIRIASMRQFL